MKILVLGLYHSLNLGDAVLTDCTAALLRRQYPQAQVIIRDLVNLDTIPVRVPLSLKQLYRSRRRLLLRSLATSLGWDKQRKRGKWCIARYGDALDSLAAENWNLAVFAGGEMFMDMFSPYICHLTEQFSQRRIPVFFHACGIGPSQSRALQRQLGRVLRLPNVHYLSCRDDVARLNRWCGGDFAVFSADSGLWADQIYGIQKDPQANTVGLGIMFANSLPPQRVIRFWQRLIRKLDRRGIPWKLFTNGAEADMCFARELLRTMDLGEDRLCPPPESPAELVKLIAGFDSLISFRLHSHIIAGSLDIPSVALLWDDKLKFYFEMMGQPQSCLTVDASPDRVLRTLAQAKAAPLDRQRLLNAREQSARQLFDALDPYILGGEPL